MKSPYQAAARLLIATLFVLPGCCSQEKHSTKTPDKPPARKTNLPAPSPGWAKVFKGPQGLILAMVRLEDDTYLARVTGTTSPLDGKVLRCKFHRDGWARSTWTYRYDGRDRILVLRRRRGPRTTMRVYLLGEPGLSGSVVTFSEADSKRLDVKKLVEIHLAQRAQGIFSRMARFRKKAAMEQVEQYVAKESRDVEKACRLHLTTHIDWKSAEPITATNVDIANECSIPFWSLKSLCRVPGVALVVRSGLSRFECRIGSKSSLHLEGKKLVWTVPRKFHYLVGTVRARLADTIKWPNAQTLAQVIYDSQTNLWTNGKGLYLGLKPMRPRNRLGTSLFPYRQFFFGTKTSGMRLVSLVKHLGSHYFEDPRYPTPEKERRFRYKNVNNLVYVRYSSPDKSLSFKCGYRRVQLKPVPRERAAAVLKGVKWLPPVSHRQPYGLARDRKGTYYYVDRAPGAEKRDFRLYRGRLGKLRRLQMTNLVTDSEGDVFSTPNGKLRLVLEKEHSYWVRKGRKERLVNVPIEKNLGLIYTDLGVYEGQPFGSPCDIF